MLINIPIRIVSEANSNEHWLKKAKRHTLQKNLIKIYFREKNVKIDQWPICVTFSRFAPRPFDSDNLQTAFKYIRDAVSEFVTGCSGAGKADSDPRITWIYKQEKTKNKEYYITIEIMSTT